jgi:uncharacterized protein (DUF2164 family)
MYQSIQTNKGYILFVGVRKKAITEKETTSNFLQGEYVVEEISEKLGQTYYKLTGFNRPFIRHELVKFEYLQLKR